MTLFAPILSVYFETDRVGGIDILLDRVRSFFKEYSQLEQVQRKYKGAKEYE